MSSIFGNRKNTGKTPKAHIFPEENVWAKGGFLAFVDRAQPPIRKLPITGVTKRPDDGRAKRRDDGAKVIVVGSTDRQGKDIPRDVSGELLCPRNLERQRHDDAPFL